MKLPEDIKVNLQDLLERYPEIQSIWLMGSRANNSAKPNSDWDILVFGNETIFNKLKLENRPNSKIDLLIVYDGNRFEGPWLRESDKARKRGNLRDWKWKLLSDSEAQYEAAKELPGQMFPRVRTEKAIKIYTK
jgi:predicted nucleotidyltransferase